MQTKEIKTAQQILKEAKEKFIAINGANYLHSELAIFQLGYLEGNYNNLLDYKETYFITLNYFNQN